MSSSKHKGKPHKSNDSGNEEKVRVLCLHGYRQNGNTFKSKIGKINSIIHTSSLIKDIVLIVILGAFRKHLQKYAEFVFLSAPHIVQIPNDETSKDTNKIQRIEDSDTSTETIESEDSRSWWFNSEDRSFKGSK